MGDIADMADLARFMRSEEGLEHLEGLVSQLQGKTITKVTFENHTSSLSMVLELDGGGVFDVDMPSLDIDVIREEFDEVLEREYYLDYPRRRPDIEP